jgi:Family of unknown function (DUF6492)
MVDSVQKHNKDKLPLYISVPESEINLFQKYISAEFATIISELEILNKNPKLNLDKLYSIRGGLRQQVIKSEFWRLGLSENYLVIDADCIFLRDFHTSDFIVKDSIPYSVVHEGKDVLLSTGKFGPHQNRAHFLKDRNPIQSELQRPGVTYDYGYAPFLWSKKVWESFDVNYLTPNNKNFLDAVLEVGSEFTWYGESLMKYQSIPIYPREQLFKHYHYEHQLWLDLTAGYTEDHLMKNYMGVVYQSNWQTWEDFGENKKKAASLALRAIKRILKKWKFKVATVINVLLRV